jgi:DNA-binding response OmpR family regulator
MATSRPFDLVYTDLGMPDMSGWEVADSIRAVRPEMPVALLTGWAATIDEAEIRSRGIAALVHKPFEINELLEVTARLLAGSAAAKDSSIPQPV